MAEIREIIEKYEALVGEIAMLVSGVQRRSTFWPDWSVTADIDGSNHWEFGW